MDNIRMECLKLAAEYARGSGHGDPIELAQKFYDFVTSKNKDVAYPPISRIDGASAGGWIGNTNRANTLGS